MELRIGFSRSTVRMPIYSQLIIWWDRYKFNSEIEISHAYGRFVSASWDRDFIYQAAGKSTHFMGGKAWAEKNLAVEEYVLDLPDEVVNRIGQICVDREGKRYGFKQTLGITISGLVWIMTFGKVDMPNPLADGDVEVNCLEEWARILSRALGVEMPKNIDGISIRPFRDWIAGLPMARLVHSV
jgi:hypothetical protein